MADEFKALTVIHLPFRGPYGKTFQAGAKITREDFEKNAAGVEAHGEPEGEHMTADEQIAYFIEWGTISDDMDAEVHPDHRPVDAGQLTLSQVIEQARSLVDLLEERGEEIPKELRELADPERRIVGTDDAGRGGEKS